MSKRLTDAECAAEYWRAAHDATWSDWGGPEGGDWETDWYGIEATLHRFATHPHAHEDAE